MPHEADITQLLLNWSGGDREALDRLMPLVYTQLRQMAHARLREQSPDHTLIVGQLHQRPDGHPVFDTLLRGDGIGPVPG